MFPLVEGDGEGHSVGRFAKALALAWFAVLFSVACSSEERGSVDQGTEVVTRTVTVPAEAPPETTSEDDPPEPTADSRGFGPAGANSSLVVGETASTDAGNEITVHSYEYVPPTDVWQPEPGFEYAAADIEGCASPSLEGSAGFNPYDFGLQMPDNTRLQPDIAVKEPALHDTTLTPGDCVRGYVTFQVPQGQTPASVIFTGSSIIKWAVQEVGQASAAGGDASEGIAPEAQPLVDVLALQYQYINAGDYESAYELFDETSKQAISLEQYRGFFEANAPYSLTDYSFPSASVQDDTGTVEATATANSASGQEQLQISQQFVREGEEWRIVMREEQVTNFATQPDQY